METGRAEREASTSSLIDRIYSDFACGIHFAKPLSSFKTNELDLVRGVLQMLQGFSSCVFNWDDTDKTFCVEKRLFVPHLSHTSLHSLLNQFMYAATCLRLVESVLTKVEASARLPPPTLRAFCSSIFAWLKRLRDMALKEEMKISSPDFRFTPTLLGLANSLSSLCSGAEYLLQIVHEAIPDAYFEPNLSIPAASIAAHILDYLYKKLDDVCLVQGGEEEAYQMLLHVFVGSLLPCIEGLDSWLFEGILDDPFGEMFFYANKEVTVDEADFWEKSYLLRQVSQKKLDSEFSSITTANARVSSTNLKETVERESSSLKGKEQSNRKLQFCPLIVRDMAKSIVSAGKSLQLIRHAPRILSGLSCKNNDSEVDGFGQSTDSSLKNGHRGQSIAGLTLSETFCVSLSGLIGHGDHVSRYFLQENWSKSKIVPLPTSYLTGRMGENGCCETLQAVFSEKIWYKFLVDTLSQRGIKVSSSVCKDGIDFPFTEASVSVRAEDALPIQKSFFPENPVMTLCQDLEKNMNAWKALNLSRNFYLPPLNDDALYKAVFGSQADPFAAIKGTNYTFGFQFGESEYLCSQDDTKQLEALFPFPTVLPSFKDDLRMSELLPFQKNSTLPARVLSWIHCVEPRITLPVVIVQECLTVYIKRQVDWIGKLILSKLMNDWRLMDELAVLRAIYLLGSGDLLQHFLTVIFGKLGNGENWDDDFELNTILQESIRNSADGMLLTAPDSLEVSITKAQDSEGDEQPGPVTVASTPRKIRIQSFGIDGLDSLKFTYKVPWPLELIANAEAIKKYNQVMGFLLKVKRAKYVLDKARRWMWKGRGSGASNRKRHWLVEQKLLHFVDAFHQYVMDRVYHNAWRELCEGMAAAGSLDEVIEVHEAYLLSIQRQCFVVPDKLWALIASRINSILSLALDFYSIQQTLSSGGAVSAIKARCEMELDRIEKQFDDCIAFLLRVLSFKLNVGHFPHLADLVTRINYNYFYMSDSGNLTTAPGSETVTSRLGKAYMSRPE